MQRRRKARGPADPRVVRIETKDRLGNSRWVTADLSDISEDGIGISLSAQLHHGSRVMVRGSLPDRGEGEFRAHVAWCKETPDGKFRAGLYFAASESNGSAHLPSANFGREADPKSQPPAPAADQLDYYEILQVSPKADTETISRVYRMLAQRYHPDHADSADPERFVQLSEAHRILCDPEQRARYDAQYSKQKQLRWKIFDQARVASSPQEEKQKRSGILGLLYAKALHDPERATMTIFEFEDLLGCPREHLQAALWYLRGKGFVQRSDNGRFAITVEGFDEVERVPLSSERLLEAPKQN